MSRRSSSLLAAACLALAALTTACGRSDVMGPSDAPAAMHESQGSNNLESQGSNN
jgi:hypothetical protein